MLNHRKKCLITGRATGFSNRFGLLIVYRPIITLFILVYTTVLVPIHRMANIYAYEACQTVVYLT